jgi:hypothetical protein
MTIKVLSSHYNENLDWISKIKYPVQVFSKTIKDENFIDFNKVQEAPAYLKYIIKNWDNLPDFTFFVHGHEFAYHQTDSIVNLINTCIFNSEFINLNRSDWVTTFDEVSIINKYRVEWEWLRSCWNDLFSNHLPFPKKLNFPCSAQFCVSKKLIQNNKIEFYKNAYEWCENTTLDNFVSGRIFEYTWHYIFTHKEEYQILQ